MNLGSIKKEKRIVYMITMKVGISFYCTTSIIACRNQSLATSEHIPSNYSLKIRHEYLFD